MIRDKDAGSVRSGQSHITSQPAFFPPFQNPGGMPSHSLGMPSRNDGPPSNLGHAWYIGKRFFFSNPTASSSAPYPHESNPWISNVSEHTSPHVMSESQAPNTALDPRCQSGPSARTSQSSPVRENFQRIMEQTNNDCRFQILILTNSPRQPRSLVGR